MDNPSRPLGKLLETPAPSFPEPVVLKGKACTLAPLAPAHFPSLYEAVCAPGLSYLWDYMLSGPFPSLPDFESYLSGLIKNNQDTTQYFTILAPILEPNTRHRPQADSTAQDPSSTHKPVGMTSLINISASQRSLEIGNVIYAPALQRTVAATEAVSLLLHHVFALGYRRVVWKCNDLNAPSKRAALRLGFEYEGLSRCHMVVKGRNRDTAWYSIVEDGWPGVRSGLQGWLGEGNFDGQGAQREKLEDVRRRLEGI